MDFHHCAGLAGKASLSMANNPESLSPPYQTYQCANLDCFLLRSPALIWVGNPYCGLGGRRWETIPA